MQAADTPAIKVVFPCAKRAVPVTYAALLIGPPISNAHMQPTITPRTSGFECSNPAKKLIIPSFIAFIGPANKDITMPINTTPITGYKKIAFKPSSCLGKIVSSFCKNKIK